MIKKMFLLFAGSYLMGIGVALASASTMGADSVALLWEGMSISFSISVGTANFLFSFLLLLIVFLLDRHQLSIGTILSPVIEGIAIDMFLVIFPSIEGFFLQCICMILGILLLCTGTGMYAYADVGRGPYIAITYILQNRLHVSLTWIRMFLDLCCLLLGVLLGALLSLGPLVSVLLCGYFTNQTIQILHRIDAKNTRSSCISIN